MRIPLRVLLMSIIVFAAFSAAGRTPRGETTFGPKVGYVSRNNSMCAGIVFQYSPSSVIRLSPEVGINFRHKNLDALTADVNVHFPFAVAGEKASVYPLVGVGYTSWGRHDQDPETTDDVTSHTGVFCVNMGAGAEVRCTQSLKLSLEARYSLMRHLPTAYVTAGIAFVF